MALIDPQIMIPVYVLLGAVAAMIYSLRRILLIERRILNMEKTILSIDKKISQKVVKK